MTFLIKKRLIKRINLANFQKNSLHIKIKIIGKKNSNLLSIEEVIKKGGHNMTQFSPIIN